MVGKKRKRRCKKEGDLKENDLPITDVKKRKKQTPAKVGPNLKPSASEIRMAQQREQVSLKSQKKVLRRIQYRQKRESRIACKKMRKQHMVGNTKAKTLSNASQNLKGSPSTNVEEDDLPIADLIKRKKQTPTSPSKRRMLIQDKTMQDLMDDDHALLESSDDESKKRNETGSRCSAGDFCYNGGDKWVVLERRWQQWIRMQQVQKDISSCLSVFVSRESVLLEVLQ